MKHLQAHKETEESSAFIWERLPPLPAYLHTRLVLSRQGCFHLLLNLSNCNRGGSPDAVHCTWVLLEEQKA
jgi:hypothetical protein